MTVARKHMAHLLVIIAEYDTYISRTSYNYVRLILTILSYRSVITVYNFQFIYPYNLTLFM